jgi:hypothetical protein
VAFQLDFFFVFDQILQHCVLFFGFDGRCEAACLTINCNNWKRRPRRRLKNSISDEEMKTFPFDFFPVTPSSTPLLDLAPHRHLPVSSNGKENSLALPDPVQLWEHFLHWCVPD